MSARIVLLALGALVLGGCASGYSAQVESDPQVEFSQYKTYAFPDSPQSDPRSLAYSPETVSRLQAAFGKRLEAAGLRRVFTEGAGDLVVSYGFVSQSGATSRIVPMAWSREHDPAVSIQNKDAYGMRTSGYDEVRTTEFHDGTLVLDLWDPRAQRVAWRAFISGKLTKNMNANFAALEDALVVAFAEFPPKPKKK